MTNVTPTLLKKMSTKTLMGATKKNTLAMLVEAGTVKVGQILFGITGNVEDTRTGETTFGTWFSLRGLFFAKRVDTGELFQSGELFLDKSTTDQIRAKLGESEGGVDISLSVALAADPDSNTGYVYVIQPLQTDTVNRSAVYLERLGAFAALPAPAPTPEPEPEPAPESKKK